jgi:3-deoxy-manno-octulosonate cytidylyltransferase (CMP-KDO synthetase)
MQDSLPTTAIIVPARLGSSRFPQKLLHPVAGKPLLLWTAERVQSEAPEYPLWFAVDGPELQQILEDAGFQSVLTDPDLPSGTDRIAAANRVIGAERIINVQGDEPLITGSQIRLLDSILKPGVEMATLGLPLTCDEDYHNPNHVKMVRAADGRALYFSRAPIPFMRDSPGHFDTEVAGLEGVLVHVGVYAYTADFLGKFAELPAGYLETLERLEMLRALEHGYTIQTAVTHEPIIEVDTIEDLMRFAQTLE